MESESEGQPKWYCTMSSGVAGRSGQNGQFQAWWEKSGKTSLPQNQQGDSCPWCCPSQKAWLQKEPETTVMACGSMSGGNFFRWNAQGVKWTPNSGPVAVTCGLSKHLWANGWFHPSESQRWESFCDQQVEVPWWARKTPADGCDHCHLPLSFQPCPRIHFVSKVTGPLQILPDQACLMTELLALWSNVKKAETLPAWKYTHAAWPRRSRVRKPLLL